MRNLTVLYYETCATGQNANGECSIMWSVFTDNIVKNCILFLYLSHLILYHIFISFNPFKLYRKHYVHNNTYL